LIARSVFSGSGASELAAGQLPFAGTLIDRKGIPEMSETTIEPPRQAPRITVDQKGPDLTSRYRQDHKNPINHFLHVGVGWPIAAISVILLPFRPYWSLVLFVSAYAIMFFGHFVFERNVPTIFKEPRTPFVVAFSVIRTLLGAARIIPSRHQAVRVYNVARRKS